MHFAVPFVNPVINAEVPIKCSELMNNNFISSIFYTLSIVTFTEMNKTSGLFDNRNIFQEMNETSGLFD